MKILHITNTFNGGGVGMVIYNFCAKYKMDGVTFDIVGEDYGKKQFHHDLFENAGFKVMYFTAKWKNLFKNIKETKKIIKEGNYDAVHVHFEDWSWLYLWLAKKCGVKIRICHAHTAYWEIADKKPHYKLFRKWLNKFATHRLACSEDAGKRLYGNNPFTVINNAIEVEKFTFNSEIRESLRESYGIKDKFVVGVVGRFTYQKNPYKTIEIFREIKKQRPDAVLMTLGVGDMYDEIKEFVEQNGLKDDVMFLKLRRDVFNFLQAMDVFVLPSRGEGLGIVYVEAQAAGLKTFGTAEVVPSAAKCTDLMTFVPKDASAKEWADVVLASVPYERNDTSRQITEAGFDLKTEVKKLENLYLSAKEDVK